MSGLVGILAKIQGQDRSTQLRLMLKGLTNESSENFVTYENRETGIWLGWSHQCSEACEQLAAWNEEKDTLLIFLGEEVEFKTLMIGLKTRGRQIISENEACLIHALKNEGTDFLAEMTGRFKGVIWNERERKLFLYVDRYGLERIYCHEDDSALYFSSEAKSLLKILPQTRQFNLSSLGEFLAFGFVFGNRTLFNRIEIVPAGSAWMFSSEGYADKRAYFKQTTLENHDSLRGAELYEEIIRALPPVMDRLAFIKNKAAVALDGGIEARILMAWAPFPPLKVPCLIPVTGEKSQEDSRVAQEVASICQQHHKPLEIQRGFFKEFPALAKKTVIYSDGTVDVSGSVDLFITRLAADFAQTFIRADFGKQILGNAATEIPELIDEKIMDGDFLLILEAGKKRFAQIRQDSDSMQLFLNLLAWRYYPLVKLTHIYMGLRLPYLNKDLVQIKGRAFQTENQGNIRMRQLVAAGDARLAKLPILNANSDTDSRLLRRCFLHGKYAARRTRRCENLATGMVRNKPSDSIDRQNSKLVQRGSSHEFRIWYQHHLNKYVSDILLDQRSRQRSYLNGSRLEEMLNQHWKGHADFSTEIHRLLTIELVQRHLIDQR